MALFDRISKAWSVFRQQENPLENDFTDGAPSYYSSAPPYRQRQRYNSEKTIISAIYTRVSIDYARLDFRHTIIDETGRFVKEKDSRLNTCLSLEPNLDQGPSAFMQDVVLTLFDKGVCALVPVDTTLDPNTNEVVDILTLRVGVIKQWKPQKVVVSVWNEETGKRQDVTLDKRFVAIVYNPLYSVMNEPNSTHQRLIRTLSHLDVVGEQASSGKLDIIIQLPYAVKSDRAVDRAEKRRDDIEMQLRGSQYGIAYADATEKITQLNRPVENNLMSTVEFLVEMLYGQLGLTKEVMDGTANETTMINYQNRTIVPIADAVREAMQRAFLGHVGTKNLERIDYYDNPFKLVPVKDLAEIADKFLRNQIFSANEFRGFIGVRPSTDPKADQLKNANVPPFEDPATGNSYVPSSYQSQSPPNQGDQQGSRIGDTAGG